MNTPALCREALEKIERLDEITDEFPAFDRYDDSARESLRHLRRYFERKLSDAESALRYTWNEQVSQK